MEELVKKANSLFLSDTPDEAHELLKDCVDKGDSRSMITLAISYKSGVGLPSTVSVSQTMFHTLLLRAEKKGDILASAYAHGLGIDRDQDVAMAMELVERDLEEMEHEQEDPKSLTLLGWCFEHQSNVEKAHECYLKAADMGFAGALFNLSLIAMGDDANAFNWCHQAAMKGHIAAQYNLGTMYENDADYVNAFKWYLKASKAEPRASLGVGLCYQEGRGVERDTVKAIEYYEKAAESGLTEAIGNLGSIYLSQKEHDRAIELFTLAATEGDIASMYNLAVCFERGRGVEPDVEKAAEWYKRASEAGDAMSQYNLAVCYWDGRGVSIDLDAAVQWFKCAAEQGHANAMYNVGVSYEYGKGVDINVEEALVWYKRAMECGDKDAKKKVLEIGDALTV